MSQITDLSFSELKQSLDDRTLSSVEIISAFLDRIESLNPTLNAFITITHDEAMRLRKKLTPQSGKDRLLHTLDSR